MLDTVRINRADVRRLTSSIMGLLQEEFEGGSFSEGTALHDLVVRPMATVAAAIEADVKYLENRFSVSQIIEEETESAAVLLDLLASNFFITRNPGGRASGTVIVKVDNNSGFTVQVGTLFERSTGVSYVYDQEQALVVTPSDLTPEVDSSGSPTGNYLAEVFVYAARPGIGAGAPPATFVSMNPAPRGLVEVYNDAPFSSESSQESNFQLANRIKSALTHRGFNTRDSISTVIQDNVDSCKGVKVVGSSDPEMRRDILQIGTATPIKSLGKINVYADTGYYVTTAARDTTQTYRLAAVEAIDSSGNTVPVKSEVGGIVLYGDVSVLNLPQNNPVREDVESSYIEITYADPNEARSTSEQITIESFSEDLVYRSIIPSHITQVEDYVDSSGVKPLGTDLKVYYPTAKKLAITLGYVRNTEVPASDFPTSLIQSSIKTYVDFEQSQGRHLSLSSLFAFISSEYSGLISAVVSESSSIGYTILDTTGNLISFNCPTDTSLDKSVPYYKDYSLINGVETESTVYNYLPDGYFDQIQISDSTCAMHCSSADVKLVEV
jgi:hypothetical protein